jgi:D-amino-acid oxidase
LGARGLKGVEDGSVFPTTGQIVTIHAPWIRTGFTWQQGSMRGVRVGMGEGEGTRSNEDKADGDGEERGENGEGGLRTYVIPRSNGEVVLGGTREIGNWSVPSSFLPTCPLYEY